MRGISLSKSLMIGTYGVHADWSTTHILFVYEPFYISFEGLDTKF